MKLKRLELKAFGPFTDRRLEFDSPDPGLHIIFGPNEAGKSSSLRALKALLYGFPVQTPDNFLHGYDALQVGGCLLGADGAEICFRRRKKRVADLLDIEGNAMDPAVLQKFTHNIEPALFESLYGIDHETLVRGGEDILAQRGEVGQVLFSAGAGISSLRKVLDSLESEADELFKAQGRVQQIPRAIKQYNELKKKIREESLSAAKYKEHDKRLKEAEADQTRLEEERRHKESEVRRLERLRKAIPELAGLNALKQQLADLGEVVLLADDFAERLAETEQGIREVRLGLTANETRHQQLSTRRREITFNHAILDDAEAIEDVHQRLGGYRKALQDKGVLEGMRRRDKREGAELLRLVRPDLEPENIATLQPVLIHKRHIQHLSTRHDTMSDQIERLEQQMSHAKSELAKVEGKLVALPTGAVTGELAKKVKLCSKLGDIDGRITMLRREIEDEKKQCRINLERIGLWKGEPELLYRAAFPLLETVRRIESAYHELREEKRQLKREEATAREELKGVQIAQREVQYGGDVPGEEDLYAGRLRRDKGWQLLRRGWLEGVDISEEARVYGGGEALPEAYEKEVARADNLADRLRREADRVAKAAGLRARRESLEQALADIAQRRENLERRDGELQGTWQEQWTPSGIVPLSPGEMLAWLRDVELIRAKLGDIFKKNKELSEHEKLREQYRAGLLEERFPALDKGKFEGPDLLPLLSHAEAILEESRKTGALRERLGDQAEQLKQTLQRAGEQHQGALNAMAKWREEWNKSLAGLGLAKTPSPAEALDLIDTLEKALAKLEKAHDFQSRIQGIERDAEAFKRDVEGLLARTPLTDPNLTLDQAVLQLLSKLGEARQNKELLRNNRRESDELNSAIEQGKQKLAVLRERMARLLKEAGSGDPAELAEKIRLSARYRELELKISAAGASLARLCEGVELERIEREARELNVDELPGLIATLKNDIEESIYPRIKECNRIIGEENKELQLMDGSSRAADAAEEMEGIGARIRRLVDQYTRAKLAAHILRVEIERYREQHQGPVLQRASGYFADMTLGSFSGLRTDLSDKGEPILVGVRPDESRLQVEAMSSGTRDQLYLALRLATLEWRLEAGEPMPFIVDDILINFDDERSRATLKALADLGARNQVILFTHHRQVVHEAKNLVGKGSVVVHEL